MSWFVLFDHAKQFYYNNTLSKTFEEVFLIVIDKW